MHWGSKHRIGTSNNSDNQRKVMVVSSIKSNNIRPGTINSSIGSAKALDASSSRNFNGSENHSSVLEPSSVNSKDMEGFRTNYNRVFGRDISNIFQSKPTIPHPSMSSRYKSNNVENIRFGSLRNNVSSSDMFQVNQSKKMSIDPPSSGRQRKISQRGNKHMAMGYKCNKNRNALSRGSTLSKNNRSNSGVRNTTYLKSHQFLRSNNPSGLQSFHTHISHTGTSSDSSK